MTSPPGTREEVVQATISDVVYRSADGHFAVVRGVREPHGDDVVLVGDFGAIAVGETVRAQGRFTQHAVHGRRFQTRSFTPVVPTSSAGVARYLGSGLIPGVGPAIAERLVKRFGARTLDVITGESARLREVSGIGRKRAEAIAAAVRARRDEAETLAYLHGLGLGPALARKVRKKYGDDAARRLREDPYRVAEEIAGIGFRTADKIGEATGIGGDDPRRAAGAVLHLVARAADDGHVFATPDQLGAAARELGVPEARVPEAIEALAGREQLVVEDGAIYAPALHRAEVAVARALATLCRPRPGPDAATRARVIPTDLGLSADQRAAVDRSLDAGLLVLTGGPGTGKTTTVRAIVAAQRALERRVALAAPTGRAAKRLTESTGAEAKTIHRLLEWSPAQGVFGRDRNHPIEADVVLVDEASMLDVALAEKLVAAVSPASRLILVGDVDQLPPVAPGQVLRDLIASGIAPVVRLTEVFRQAQESAIVRGAHAILAGKMPEPSEPGVRGPGELYVIRARDAEAAQQRLLDTVRRAGEAYGLDPRRDIQVLTPMRRGPAGTEQLNALLAAALNPQRRGAAPLLFAPGDRVMQLRNDYDRDVFNGDVGEVRRAEGGITYVIIDGREVQYDAEDLESLTLAYASTIHKVQGSEFPAVVVVFHGSHHLLLTRALIYTAITRAKRLVVLLGDERAMAKAVGNAHSYRTNSRLKERLTHA